MIRGFKYRFYPTPEQARDLARTFGAARFVYNWGLHLRTQAWYEKRQRVNYAETSGALTDLKKQAETAWLNEISSVPTQQALRHLQTAFANFFEKRAKYPTFRKKSGPQSAEYTKSAFEFESGELTIAKIGRLKIKWSRRFTGEPTTVTISKTEAGRYYVSFRVDEPIKKLPKTKSAVGVDLGIAAFATTSTGSKFTAPRPLKRKLAQLKRAQKALARKLRGSKNRNKARIRVAKINQKIADIRNDFLHKLTTRLVRENQTIAVEDLAIRNMIRNHALAQAISDSAWGEFARQLKYKCEWYGRTLVQVDRFFPSSKRCSHCGYIADSMPLDIRRWTCSECSVEHDRDVNAAINILAAGHAVIASGDGARPVRPQGRKGSRPRRKNQPVSRA